MRIWLGILEGLDLSASKLLLQNLQLPLSSLLELASAAPWHVGNGILFTSVLRAHPSRNSCGINPLLQCMGMSSLPAMGWEWKSHQMSGKAGAQQLGVEAVTSVELLRAPRVKAALKGQEWLQWGSFSLGECWSVPKPWDKLGAPWVRAAWEDLSPHRSQVGFPAQKSQIFG